MRFSRHQYRLDRAFLIFRRDLDHGCTVEVEAHFVEMRIHLRVREIALRLDGILRPMVLPKVGPSRYRLPRLESDLLRLLYMTDGNRVEKSYRSPTWMFRLGIDDLLLRVEPDFDQLQSFMRGGLPFPLSNGILRGLHQKRMSAFGVHGFHAPIGLDHNVQPHTPLNAHFLTLVQRRPRHRWPGGGHHRPEREPSDCRTERER